MNIVFSKNAWEEYTSWQTENKKILVKINKLIKEIKRTPFEGIGKPETLKFDLAGLWSRRIDLEHRLVCRIVDNELVIYSCKYHSINVNVYSRYNPNYSNSRLLVK